MCRWEWYDLVSTATVNHIVGRSRREHCTLRGFSPGVLGDTTTYDRVECEAK